ncbi:MAG TPA: AsmA-like C-terminal region-containing protein [Bradyrhizobium sp.]|nr:AsmA-like C-terminal region-containing protein [Bradyrhizobium sp.]
MQTTLLGLAIAFIIALVTALIGPFFIDWNQFRPQFEAKATEVIGAPVKVGGELQARLLPSPSLRLRSVVVGGANDLGKVHADKLEVEFSLGSLMRGEWRATELTINGMALDLGLDPNGRIDWPASTGRFNLGTLSIDRLSLTGRVALHDALSRGTVELNDIAFSGDMRSLAGSVRGEGNFSYLGERHPFRVSSGQSADGGGTRLHLSIDPGTRALSADLDGVLSFEARAPRFEGTVTLAALAAPKAKRRTEPSPVAWRLLARVKADHAAAKLDQIEASYGNEDSALKLAGMGDIRFGASPSLHAALSARQLDADKFSAREKDLSEPVRVLPAIRALIAAVPLSPIPAKLELAVEQITLGGRALQNVAADIETDGKSWSIDRLDLRAPGGTRVSLSGSNVRAGSPDSFKGALSVEASDPDALVMWLQGRSELTYRSQKPMHLSGDVNFGADRVAIESIKCEFDGGAVEGRIAFSHGDAGGASLGAELKAERLDLDSASAFARALLGPKGDWPERAKLSLDVGHAISAGQDLHPFLAKLTYDPKTIAVDRLTIGEANDVVVEGNGAFDRINETGKLALNSSAASLSQFTGIISPLAPALASRLQAMGLGAGPARLRLALAVDKDSGRTDRASARASLDLDAPQFKGSVTVAARPDAAALREIDLDRLRRSEITVESKMSAEQGASLLALLGLNGAVAAADGPGQFQGTVTGVWDAPLRLKVNLSGAGLVAEATGTAEPFAPQPKVSVAMKARGLNLAPMFGLKPSDKLAQDISLSSNVSLEGGKLKLEDIDSTLAGSRLRGRLAVTLDGERKVEGEIGMAALDVGPAFELAIGAAGRDAGEPLGPGLLKGWRGRIGFMALRGILPGGIELYPISGTVKSDGQSLVLEGIKGTVGGGEGSASLDIRHSASGLALNARIAVTGADGSTLRYRALAMPAGRATLQMAVSSQGRSASALTGALSGSGTVTVESARVAGLDPRAFDAAIRASDAGQALDDSHLRKIVEPVLSGGALSVASAQIPFTIRDGRLRVGPTTLDAGGASAVVSGGYDIPADQFDIRAALASASVGQTSGRPEIIVFAGGTPDALERTVDVASLSSWLAVRAIDRETRRLDSIEHGEPLPASIPPAAVPEVLLPGQPPSEVLGREPRRLPPKPKAAGPRPLAAVPAPNTPATGVSPAVPPSTGDPVVGQQVPPLPPPIEVRPAPNVIARPPKPKAQPPLLLTPPAQGTSQQTY